MDTIREGSELIIQRRLPQILLYVIGINLFQSLFAADKATRTTKTTTNITRGNIHEENRNPQRHPASRSFAYL